MILKNLSLFTTIYFVQTCEWLAELPTIILVRIRQEQLTLFMSILSIVTNIINRLGKVAIHSESKKRLGEEEFHKLCQVKTLISSINDYLDLYTKLVERGELYIVGTKIYSNPCHQPPLVELPSFLLNNKRKSWNQLSQEEQYQTMHNMAVLTQEPMKHLLEQIQIQFPFVKTKVGPLKGKERVLEKRDNDYGGNILRVIDIVRCSVVLPNLSIASTIVDCFRCEQGIFTNEWELLRIKDGFEKPDNYVMGGYRDIKLNVRYKKTGHVIEIQLHLQEFFELKENGSHKLYEFARTHNIHGITDELQLVQRDHIPYIIEAAEHFLTNQSISSQTTIQTLIQIGSLKAELNDWSSALQCYETARNHCIQHVPNDCLLFCQVLEGYASCIFDLWYYEYKNFGTIITGSKFMVVDVVAMIDQAIEGFQKLSLKHPTTLRARRLKLDVIIFNIWRSHIKLDERDGIDQQYEELINTQKEVFCETHPEVTESCIRFGTHLCTSTSCDEPDPIRKSRFRKGIKVMLEGLENAMIRMQSRNAWLLRGWYVTLKLARASQDPQLMALVRKVSIQSAAHFVDLRPNLHQCYVTHVEIASRVKQII